MARKIVITSGKGGVGKTTICANLGVALSKLNFKVCLIDLDIGLNNLDVAFDVSDKIIFDINDVASLKCRVNQALLRCKENGNLFLLPSNQSYAKNTISLVRLKEIVASIDGAFDYILIDCPAGIEDGFYRATSLANEAIVVATSHIFSIRDASKVIRILSTLNFSKTSLIINRQNQKAQKNGDIISPEFASKLLDCTLVGVVCENDDFLSNYISKNQKAIEDFATIAKNINSNSSFLHIKKPKFFNFFKKGERNAR